ncbi:MAG: dipeptide ABC transporter ATP-binding protein [SAR324 cluster bacterium]|nr:dipeptide ABC transporter ATP-binding protein [SAR324 cluster bacterium]
MNGQSSKIPVLEVKHLNRYYTVKKGLFEKATVKAVNNINFQLEAGKTLAVVGESGCGKSTLAKVLTMIDEPTSGEIFFDGQNLLDCSAEERKALRQKVQIIFQDPYGSLNPRKKLGTIIGEPLKINTTLSGPERKKRVQAMMAKVGLRPEFFDRYPHMFSGGQRQRIAVARALMLNPKIVIADEPVSALDVSIQAQVLNLLMDLQDELGLAYVFISHDLSVVEHIANDVIVMYLGQIVEYGNTKTIFSNPRHPYTQALLASTPKIDRTKRQKIRLSGEIPSPLQLPEGCPFQSRCVHSESLCSNQRPELESFDQRKVACLRIKEISDTLQ